MPRWRRALLAIVGAGTAIRLILLATGHGQAYDMGSFNQVRVALEHDWLHVYRQVNPATDGFHWPYPPAFFSWIAFADALKGGVLAFDRLMRVPAVLADAALAWIAARELLARTGSQRAALAAAALIAFGPAFVIISGYHGQIDSAAILPAVAAALIWERGATRDRALAAGALIGLAGAIKTVPIVMVIALAPTARDWREGVRLLAAAAAVVIVTLLPFLIADLGAVRHVGDYSGVPGAGGLSLLVQPDLARVWLTGLVHPNGLTHALVENATLVNAAVLAAVAVLLAIRRPPALRAATILWLAVWAFGSGFFFQYLLWGLPFLILDRHLIAAAALQAAVLVPMLLFYLGPWHHELVVEVYAAAMLAVWVGWCAGIVALGRRRAAPVAPA